jgi:hypothetical protein
MISLSIDIEIDDSRLLEVGRQVPFAMYKAMNNSMVKAQLRVRGRMRAIYTIRRPRFLELTTKITQFAKKDLLVTELAISPPGSTVPSGREDIFEKFETGGIKKPHAKNHHIAIPVLGSSVKRTRTAIVADENRPRALLDNPAQLVSSRTGKVKDVKRTKAFGGAFIRPAQDGKSPVIFIRRGRHLELAYVLKPDVPIKDNLKFEDTASAAFIKDFPTEFRNQLARAVAQTK